jgi:hypothetical protein
MSFESCFGGFAGSKSAPAAMGGEGTFPGTFGNGEVAPKAVLGLNSAEPAKPTLSGHADAQERQF